MTRDRFILRLLGALLLSWCGAPAAFADAPREYQLKAAFIYNFVQFVEWPGNAFPDPRAALVVATVGDDPFEGALDKALGGKSVGGRLIVVRHFARPSDVQGCQLIFIADGQEDQFSAIARKLGNAPVLTIGETEAFAREGGIIRFYEEDNRLRFEINRTAAERAGLRISSRLLKLARIRQG